MKMIITEQQALVLFDIGKEAMKQKGGFAGYSNEEIMRLLNDIIAQQDNKENIIVRFDATNNDNDAINSIDNKVDTKNMIINDAANDAINDAAKEKYDDYVRTRNYSDPASDALELNRLKEKK